MITKLGINGFKTFENFQIILSPLVIIAGTNGSGKSNLFDALQLLSRLAQSDLKTAFGERDTKELFTQYPDGSYAKSMRFVVEMLVDKHVKDNWGKQKTLDYTRLKYDLEIRRGFDKRGFERLYIDYESLTPICSTTDNWYQRYINHPHWQPETKTDSESMLSLWHDLATNFNEPVETEFPLRQLIINTHSPVLVGHLFKHAKNSLTVFYATLFSRINSGKTLRLTKMIPVLPSKPLETDITEPERKITLSELQKYLGTKEFNQGLVLSK